MNIDDIKKKNKEELENLLKEERDRIRNFRFQVRQGKVKNNKMARESKKTIARIFTHLRSM